MVFLKVNNWTVPVDVKSGTEKLTVVGARKTSLNGRPLLDERRRIPSWEFETKPLTPHEAVAMQMAINGSGHLLGFDSDLYTSRGLGPTSGDETVPVNFAVGNDGIRVFDNATQKYLSQHRSTGDYSNYDQTRRCAQPYTDLTNLMTANQASPSSGVTGWNAVASSTPARATDYYFVRGAVADQAMTTGMGWISDAVTLSGSAVDVVAVAYVKVSGYTSTATVTLDILDDPTGTTVVTESQAVVSGTPIWLRFAVYGTTADAAVKMRITCTVSSGTFNLWSDAHAVYERTPRATISASRCDVPWVDNGTTSASDLTYDVSGMDFDRGVSMAGWVRTTTTGLAGSGVRLLTVRGDDSTGNTHALYLDRSAATNNIRASYQDDDTQTTIDYTTSPWDGGWVHVAITWAPDDKMRLFVDGSEVGTAQTISGFRPLVLDTFEVGHTFGFVQWEGWIDDVMLVPYRMHADQIAAYASHGEHTAPLPLVRAEGDFYPEGNRSPTLVRGYCDQSEYAAVAIAETWYSNARKLKFELTKDPDAA